VTVPLVVDAEVLVRYARLDAGVGEMVGEVNNGGGRVGVPVLAVARALRWLTDDDETKRLSVLLHSDAVLLLAVAAGDGQAMARHARLLSDDWALAQVVIEAAREDALVYTGSGRLLREQYGDVGIIDLDEA
jgi:hypothetical protein